MSPEIVENFLNKNISEDSKKRYRASLKNFSNFIDMPLSDFVKKIKDEQIPFLRKKIIKNEFGEKEEVQQFIEPDIQNGLLAKKLKEFYFHEKERGLSDNSIKGYIVDIRSFLKENNIKLPRMFSIDSFTNPKKFLKWEKIKRAIEKTPYLRNKALFAFMASTGLRSKDIRNLKIKDFLKAVEAKSINDLLTNSKDKIGYWELKPSKTRKRTFNSGQKSEKGYSCKTGSTPYANKLLIEYLQERAEKEELNINSYLFVTIRGKGTKIKRMSLINLFSGLNKELFVDDLRWFKNQLKLWLYDKQKGLPHERGISPEKYEEEINDIAQFHAHGLRAYFINTVSSRCSNLKIVAAMEGHKSPIDTDSSYTNFNRSIIITHYTPLIPYLSFEKTIVNIVSSDDYKEIELLKKENKEIKQAFIKFKQEVANHLDL